MFNEYDELGQKEDFPNQPPSYFNELYDDAIRFFINEPKVEISALVKYFGISYTLASEIITKMEKKGLVESHHKGENRNLLIDDPLNINVPSDRREQIAALRRTTPKKIIGVWSPQGNKGATTLSVNYAMYLTKRNYEVAVVEGISKYPRLKEDLWHGSPFITSPLNLNSWANSLTSKKALKDCNPAWNEYDVHWLPLDKQDSSIQWDFRSTCAYFNKLKCHIVFLDITSGVNYEDRLPLVNFKFIDELLIVTDDNINQMLALKLKIQRITKNLKIPVRLVCNYSRPNYKLYDFVEKMEIPLLSHLPDLSKIKTDILQPLMENSKVKRKLNPIFKKVTKELDLEQYQNRFLV